MKKTNLIGWIPGHIRANTWEHSLLLGITAYETSGKWLTTLAAIVLPLTSFLGDQATHLAQMEHHAAPLTWFERQQQRYHEIFQVAGLAASCFTLWLLLL